MRFSERIGARPASMDIHVDWMSTDLRNSLWNVIHIFFVDPHKDTFLGGELLTIAERGHLRFFKLPLDELPDWTQKYVRWLKGWFMYCEWHETYDFVEWLGNYGVGYSGWEAGREKFETASHFRRTVNSVLEAERSAYRFVGVHLAPITNAEEVREIELAAARTEKFDAVGEHIRTAIQLFSDRKTPDLRNSIKEAISGVEAAAKVLTKSPKATLDDALKVLERTTNLHPALKVGFSKIIRVHQRRGWNSARYVGEG